VSVSGKLWAELSHVAWCDAQSVYDSARGSPREGDRLSLLSARFAYRAREMGFCLQGTDHIFGDEPQTFKVCGCDRRYETREDWQDLESRGVMSDGEGNWLELKNCECGSTIAVECPAPLRSTGRRAAR
jgi:hypothetical protein